VYGKERASRIEGREGHGPAQSPLSADTTLPGFTFVSLPRARARSFIFPSALSFIVLFNCFRPHRALCHPPLYLVSSIRLATGLCSHTRCCAPLPPRRLFIGLPAKSASEHSGAPPALAPCPNRASCLTLDTARHTLVPS
jgi:hypothetical protein